LSEPEKNWIIIHEVMHPALKHLWRKGDRNHKKWNFACDYAIHSIIMQFIDSSNSGMKDKLKAPPGALINRDYDDKPAEEIYDLLPENYDNSNGNGSGNGSGDGQTPLDDHSKWEESETQTNGQTKSVDWEGRLISAAKAAESKSAGDMPGFLKRLLNKLTKPQKDWRQLLAEFVEVVNDDYSWNPPDKRFTDFDFFMPDLTDQTEVVKNIIFYIDTSGSIGDKELAVAYSEIVGAIEQYRGKLKGKLGFFDHVAYSLYDFEDVESVLAIRPEGGGGTNFHAPFEYVTENVDSEEVAGIIMLTDGYCDFPPESIANDKPVLWLINNEEITPPWGLYTTLKV
jgi:predicted metal-dependent peptidase